MNGIRSKKWEKFVHKALKYSATLNARWVGNYNLRIWWNLEGRMVTKKKFGTRQKPGKIWWYLPLPVYEKKFFRRIYFIKHWIWKKYLYSFPSLQMSLAQPAWGIVHKWSGSLFWLLILLRFQKNWLQLLLRSSLKTYTPKMWNQETKSKIYVVLTSTKVRVTLSPVYFMYNTMKQLSFHLLPSTNKAPQATLKALYIIFTRLIYLSYIVHLQYNNSFYTGTLNSWSKLYFCWLHWTRTAAVSFWRYVGHIVIFIGYISLKNTEFSILITKQDTVQRDNFQ